MEQAPGTRETDANETQLFRPSAEVRYQAILPSKSSLAGTGVIGVVGSPHHRGSGFQSPLQ
jgi:hypothetical protein